MKILEIRALRGANYWSNRWRKLIVMKLDIEDYEEKPSDKIPGFAERLKELMPSLYTHTCSYGYEGGFLQRVDEGTWAGHIIEHIALEIQTLAGMDTGFGRTRETNTKGVYNVVFSYLEEKAGVFSAKASVDLYLYIAEGKKPVELKQKLDEIIQELREIREEVRFGPSTGSIIEEAEQRGIPHIRLNDQSLVQLGYGVYQKIIQATVSCNTGYIATDIASDKNLSKQLLESMGVPVPKGFKIYSEDEVEESVESIGFPVAVKPLDSNHGKGISANINTLEDAVKAFHSARKYSRAIIIEKSLSGSDFRALVINNKLIAVAERTPAFVKGDGKSTIKELIEKVNEDPRRGYGHEKILTQIIIDGMTLRLLELKGYTPDTILKKDEICSLKSTANISTGGTAIDRTDEVHPDNIFLFERIAKIIGLDIAGIDVVAPDITTPLTENGGGIVEINAAPGFRMHLAPSEGIARNVAEPVVNMLFPAGEKFRIPIIAVTGTNGKTTTTRLISHILKNVGKTVGFTTTEGVYIGNRLIKAGDNTGPVSAQMVLRDPTVDIAVLETARGGLLRAGLGYDGCDIGIVMNVTADHLGLKDIDSLEDMARVKAIVAENVFKSGYAVLNADDKLVLAMKDRLSCNVALFSMDENNEAVKAHTNKGGIACVYENHFITLLKGHWKLRVEKVINIPLTYQGKAAFMIQNVLAATLASYILHGVSIEDIKFSLSSFVPSVTQTPGRLNLIDVGNFTVLIDFAHNPAGMEALSKFVEKLTNKIKTGIIGGTGDRRDEDIKNLGKAAAKMLTNIIIREDESLRGRKEGEVHNLMLEGIKSEKPDVPVKVITDEVEALNFGLKNAKKNELLIILPDNIPRAIKIVNEFRDKLNKIKIEQSDIPNINE
ncbi:MAG TPA: cyanophycin synthetase [Ignavibacteria bacterium]|nr:cyanophycin synthetase [Bacteroidota bacterium]HRI85879.1 cyanophycin synthetase [Ignavibacteria bacterium]HRJ98153.1 cyanophycin synthetase [Ignavibacteria bacterium]